MNFPVSPFKAMMYGVALVALASSAPAQSTSTIEPEEAPPPLDLPINPAVTQATIASTICAVGWTKTVRPSYAVTNRIKLEKLRQAGLTEGDKSRFELDHLIPLALGGATDDPGNLALEPWSEATKKDVVEVCLSAMVCEGKISLERAQLAIWEDWKQAGKLCE
jgi:hypothetical protein